MRQINLRNKTCNRYGWHIFLLCVQLPWNRAKYVGKMKAYYITESTLKIAVILIERENISGQGMWWDGEFLKFWLQVLAVNILARPKGVNALLPRLNMYTFVFILSNSSKGRNNVQVKDLSLEQKNNRRHRKWIAYWNILLPRQEQK